MKYQLLCVDLDGTLLDNAKQLPTENQEAIRLAWHEGTEICIASGRTYQSAAEYLKMMGITGSVVALNGGQVYFHGKEISRTVMDQKLVQRVIDLAAETGTYVCFNSKDRMFILNESFFDVQDCLKGNAVYLETYQTETPEHLKRRVEKGEVQFIKISFREDDPVRMEELRKSFWSVRVLQWQNRMSIIWMCFRKGSQNGKE